MLKIINATTVEFNLGNLVFRWNPEKAKKNLHKHHVSFKEAASVFLDENLYVDRDGTHSWEEERFNATGYSKKDRILYVCHCYRERDDGVDIVRIISAREATKDEISQYNQDISEEVRQ
ncbi:MAG: BrnT family toxin [Defluviitaleaceae bacterium]|nr:BrnT family toxin [Defluviitaleaceae bacterium]MCL2262789.1 BrnT family toxin [Defluviitaleaceae bacterium]